MRSVYVSGLCLQNWAQFYAGLFVLFFFFLTVLIPFSDTDNIRLELKKNYISMSSFLMNRNLNLALSICLMLLMSREEQNLDPDADRTQKGQINFFLKYTKIQSNNRE